MGLRQAWGRLQVAGAVRLPVLLVLPNLPNLPPLRRKVRNEELSAAM